MTNVYISSEVRMHRDSLNRIRAAHNAARYEKWVPYVEALGQVRIVARLNPHLVSDAGYLVEGAGVTVAPLPYYEGLRGMVATAPAVFRAARAFTGRRSVFIGRLPEPIALLLARQARRVRGRFVSLVVSDPRQLGKAAAGGILGTSIGLFLSALTTACVKRSAAVIYVTQEWLQSLYPAKGGTPTLARSNVVLPEEAFVASSRKYRAPFTEYVRLVSVGAMNSRYKGFDTLIEVIAKVQRSSDVKVLLTIVGGGHQMELLRAQAATCGVERAVIFAGHLDDAQEVRRILDEADVYVSTARVEGLPRAVVEAMARALPVIATRAGGTGELVEQRFLTEIDNVEEIAEALGRLIRSPEILAEASAASLSRARKIAVLAEPARLTEFLIAALRVRS